MLSRLATVCLVFLTSLTAAQYMGASSPNNPVIVFPGKQAIDDAATLSDPIARESALREAIRKGLLESKANVANEVLGYLGMNSRWLDLRPFEDIITEFGRSNNPTSRNVGWFLDSVELGRMSRDERLRIYSAAIVEGRTTLQHGWPLLRQTAIGAAAIDGLAELKPLIEAHYPEESAEVRSAFPLPELLVRLELGAGASDREDANRLASERLAAMKDADFRDRMNTDAAFQKVVGDIATYVCAVDTFAPRRNPGCASIKDIVKRQEQLDKKVRQASGTATTTSISTMQRYEERIDSWLGRMEASSAGEPSVQRPH